MHVDKTGRDDLVARIDDAPRFDRSDAPDAGDASVLDGHVRAKHGITRAVYDARVGDDKVVWPNVTLPDGSEFGRRGEGQRPCHNQVKKRLRAKTITH